MSTQSLEEKKAHYVSHYLEKTLGITQILNQFETQKPQVDLGFFIEDYLNYTEPELDQLQKIILAMKLNPHQIRCFDLQDLNANHTAQMTVRFVDDPQNPNETYSPARLLKNPEFKKATWDFLKSILNQLASK